MIYTRTGLRLPVSTSNISSLSAWMFVMRRTMIKNSGITSETTTDPSCSHCLNRPTKNDQAVRKDLCTFFARTEKYCGCSWRYFFCGKRSGIRCSIVPLPTSPLSGKRTWIQRRITWKLRNSRNRNKRSWNTIMAVSPAGSDWQRLFSILPALRQIMILSTSIGRWPRLAAET